MASDASQGLCFKSHDRSAVEGQLMLSFLPKSPVPPIMWTQQDKGAEISQYNLGGAAIHQIIAITAFPFHWDTSRDTHTHEDPLLYLQGMPAFILQPWFRETNEHKPSTSILQEGSSIHPPVLLWNPMYLPKAKPTVSQYTHHSSLAVSLLCACSPCCGTLTVKSPVPPLHTVPSSKGGWRGM